jgi:hypothetical protein
MSMADSFRHAYSGKQVFAVYVGLTASGYDMAVSAGNDVIGEMLRMIKESSWPEELLAYFRRARTNSCAVNPYWPRAFLVALASLYLPQSPPYQFGDPDRVTRHIKGLNTVAPAEKDEDTIQWIMELPAVYRALWERPLLSELWRLYESSIDRERCEKLVGQAVSLINKRIGASAGQRAKIAIIPNPLQAPEATDFVALDGKGCIIAADPNLQDCVHEMLHSLLSPALESSRKKICEFAHLLDPVRSDMLELAYAWDDTPDSWCRVFEEHLIRAGAIWINAEEEPAATENFCSQQDRQGFKYIPTLIRCFEQNWLGIEHIEEFILKCLRECEMQFR